MRDQHISLKNSPRRFSKFRSLPPLLDNARQCEQGGVVSGAYFLHRVLELHARALKLRTACASRSESPLRAQFCWNGGDRACPAAL